MRASFFYDLPKHPIGTKFVWHKAKGVQHDVTVVGYHVEYNTDTENVDVTYRIAYNFAGLQDMVATVARSTVDMAVIKQSK